MPGDECDYPQFCQSLKCVGEEGNRICSEDCNPLEANTCPNGLVCVETGPETGLCFTESGGGCCSVSNGRPPWAQIFASMFVFAALMRRRRRR